MQQVAKTHTAIHHERRSETTTCIATADSETRARQLDPLKKQAGTNKNKWICADTDEKLKNGSYDTMHDHQPMTRRWNSHLHDTSSAQNDSPSNSEDKIGNLCKLPQSELALCCPNGKPVIGNIVARAQKKQCWLETRHPQDHGRLQAHVGIHVRCTMSLCEVVKEESHLTLNWHAQVSFVDGINQTDHSNSERPCTTTHKTNKKLRFWQSLLCLNLVSFPVLNRLKQQASLGGGDGTAARCVTSESSLAHSTFVTADEPCHFFCGHVYNNERTRRACTVYLSEIWHTTIVDIFLIGYAWFRTWIAAPDPVSKKQTISGFFLIQKEKATRRKADSGNFHLIPKLDPKKRTRWTGKFYLIRQTSPEKKRYVLILTGIVLLDGAARQKYQHTSLRSHEHLCDSIATVTTDTYATLHSTRRKRSRSIITLNTQYLLSFVIAHSNSKTRINLASLLPTQADTIIRFSKRSIWVYKAWYYTAPVQSIVIRVHVPA